MRRAFALIAFLGLTSCTGTPAGNEMGVTIRSPSETHAYQTATEWCSRYGKLPRLTAATGVWIFDCVPKG